MLLILHAVSTVVIVYTVIITWSLLGGHFVIAMPSNSQMLGLPWW